eukprot:3739831-Prymnesium_polylepis.2
MVSRNCTQGVLHVRARRHRPAAQPTRLWLRNARVHQGRLRSARLPAGTRGRRAAPPPTARAARAAGPPDALAAHRDLGRPQGARRAGQRPGDGLHWQEGARRCAIQEGARRRPSSKAFT